MGIKHTHSSAHRLRHHRTDPLHRGAPAPKAVAQRQREHQTPGVVSGRGGGADVQKLEQQERSASTVTSLDQRSRPDVPDSFANLPASRGACTEPCQDPALVSAPATPREPATKEWRLQRWKTGTSLTHPVHLICLVLFFIWKQKPSGTAAAAGCWFSPEQTRSGVRSRGGGHAQSGFSSSIDVRAASLCRVPAEQGGVRPVAAGGMRGQHSL